MMSPTKNPKPKKVFFKTCWAFGGFVNSALAQSSGELWSCKALANMGKLYLSA